MKRYSLITDIVPTSDFQSDIEHSQLVEDEGGDFVYISEVENLLAETLILKSKVSDLETVIDRLERTITTLSAKVVKAKEILDGR